MKVKTMLMVSLMMMFIATYTLSVEASGEHEQKGSMKEQKGSMMGHMEEGASPSIEVGNKICPVTGEKVGGDMGPAVQYEYKGKIYNFCCTGCVETFKKNPEKYVKIIEEQMGQHKEIDSGHGSQGKHHVMGEKDANMMMEAVDEKPTQTKEETVTSTQIKEFDLEAYQYGYSPERIVVKKGNIVKLHATSRDVPHGVFIKEYGINEKVEKGKVKEIEFVADKAGEFEIVCSVYCGRKHHSMKAKLIVNE